MTRFVLLLLFALSNACSKPTSSSLPLGKPVFDFNYETVRELLIAKRDPENPSWSTRLIQEGYVGPQEVTPKWIIKQSPEGTAFRDSLADGALIRHLLDNLKTLRKIASPPHGKDVDYGLSPPWTRLEWKEGQRSFQLDLGAPSPSGGRYARIGDERLIVEGAALEMLSFISQFQKIRHQRLFLWTLDDADRISIRWKSQKWSAERSTGDWVQQTPQGTKPFRKSPAETLEALAHLQIAAFDLDPTSFQTPIVTIEWLDRKNRRVILEIDSDLRAKSSDRPGSVFQLYSGARALLEPSRFQN